MTDTQKRQYVANLYHGPKWKRRVEKMEIDQVVAIFLKHQREGIKPHHDELHLYVPPQDPHHNEDDFPIY